MKGIVLAGGLGTRLLPLTKITNKHLLPVYDQPMIYFPIQKLVEAGITEIMIVTGGNSAGDFLRLLKNGKDFGLRRLHYTYQEGEGGIAEALGLTEEFAEGERVVVILGDNIFEDNLTPYIKDYEKQPAGAKILLKEVPNPERFGVAEIINGKITRIIEKPKIPPSNFAVTGIYMYDQEVYGVIKTLKPSERGELEITDVNNYYLNKNALTYDILKGWWQDAGSSFEAYYRAISLIRSLR
ncbi:MAG: sugar phosphate nucleotidyltransferase, partial [candidate division WOR-3 bacterium]|nr:sugar phosphate nucleotidyltransferase [candidate division WOR-3 bacterium]MDW7987191.1 sugar phosphate nucleotidyltransferase [candidate division WOR-3 bacterium]